MAHQDSSIHRPVVESVEFAIDYDPDLVSSGTWTTIPRTQILNDGYEAFGESAETVQGMNLQDLMAQIIMRGVLPVALKANDIWQVGLVSATTDLTAVWFRIKELGKNTFKIIGGQFGCIVVYERQAVPNPGSLTSATITVTAPANESGQGIQDHLPGSGS